MSPSAEYGRGFVDAAPAFVPPPPLHAAMRSRFVHAAGVGMNPGVTIGIPVAPRTVSVHPVSSMPSSAYGVVACCAVSICSEAEAAAAAVEAPRWMLALFPASPAPAARTSAESGRRCVFLGCCWGDPAASLAARDGSPSASGRLFTTRPEAEWKPAAEEGTRRADPAEEATTAEAGRVDAEDEALRAAA